MSLVTRIVTVSPSATDVRCAPPSTAPLANVTSTSVPSAVPVVVVVSPPAVVAVVLSAAVVVVVDSSSSPHAVAPSAIARLAASAMARQGRERSTCM
jgi:hypothetical protein